MTPGSELPSRAGSSGEEGIRSLLGSGAIYTVATVAPILSTLLVTPIVTRLLSPSQYGLVGIGVSIYQVGLVLLALGLPAAITRHAIIEGSGVAGASGLVVSGAGAVIGGGVAFALFIPVWGPLVLPDGGLWILLWPVSSAVGLSVLMLCLSLLRALERVVLFALLGSLSALVSPLLGVLGILVSGSRAENYLLGLSIGQVFVGFLALILTVRIAKPSFSLPVLKLNLRIGLPTVPHSISTALLTSALVVVTGHLGGLENAGRLQLALLLGTAPLVLLGAFNNAWAPMIYRATAAIRTQVLSRSTQLVAVIVFTLGAGFCMFAEPVVHFIGGPQIANDAMVQAAILVTTAAPFMLLYLANIHLVFLSGKTGFLAVTTPLSVAISLIVVVVGYDIYPSADVRWFALGLPVFHACQVGMSTVLRRRSGYEGARFAASLPVLGLSLLVSLVAMSALADVLPSVIAGLVLIAIVLVTNRRVFLAAPKEKLAWGHDKNR